MTQLELLKQENAYLREQQAESIRLLKSSKTQCGMMLGEQIDEHIASLEGRKHNAAEWRMDDLNGEQGV